MSYIPILELPPDFDFKGSIIVIDKSKTIPDSLIKLCRENLHNRLENGKFKPKKSRQLSFGKNGGLY